MLRLPNRTLAFAVFFLIALPPLVSFAQVTIKEKVEINPKQSFKSSLQQVLSSVQPHQSISVKFTWTPSTMYGRLFILGGACLQGPTDGYGSIELQGVATPDGYSFNIQLRTAEIQPGQSFGCSIRATVGNEILFEENNLSFVSYPGGIFSGSYPSFSYLPGYFSRFDVFSQADSIYANESASFRVYDGVDCSGTLWQPSDSIHFKIIKGGDLGTFVDAQNRTLGPEVTMLADDFSSNNYQQKVRFIANGPAAANGGIVTVQGTSGEVISTTSFKVNKTTLNLKTLSMPTELYYGEEGYIRVQTVRPDGVESAPPRTVTYAWSILSGNESGYLFRGAVESDTIIAPQFSGQGTIGFRARQDSIGEPRTVQVRVTPSDPTISPLTTTFQVVPSPLLILVSPTARYGDTLQVEVRRKQSSSDTVGIPLASDAWVGYLIFRSLNAGYFTTLDASNAGDEIYGENRKALFIAKEESPQPDSVQVQFAVTVLDEGSGPASGLRLPLAGVGKVIIKKSQKQLKFVNHGPWEIWPNLKSSARSVSGYNPKRSFEIQVLNGSGEPLKDESVVIKTDFVAASGGHAHNAPPLSRTMQGKFWKQGASANPMTTLKTDSEGKVTVDSLVASQIAGRYLVTAYLAADTTVRDTVNLQVRVPGLVNFRDLIVLEEKPFKFQQSAEGEANHPDNDWCKSEMGNSLYLAILDFYEWTRSQKGGSHGMITSLNDMSLMWGGYFDIRANWDADARKPSHFFHRVGISVDVNLGQMSKRQLNRLTRFMSNRLGERYPEPQIHYGFFGGN